MYMFILACVLNCEYCENSFSCEFCSSGYLALSDTICQRQWFYAVHVIWYVRPKTLTYIKTH